MPKKKLQIFISSTYLDLQEERQAAVGAVLKAGHIPAGMELFTSGDESQWDTITRWIDESDIYMLILGGRYGSTNPKTDEGYTEMEYDYAVAAGKPYFAVVITEDALDAKVSKHGKNVLELEHPDKLKLFRTKVLNRMSSFFTDFKDIKLAIHETIPNLEQRNSSVGWISGADFTDTKPLVDELAKLGEENRDLRKEASRLKAELGKPKTNANNDDFTELRKTLAGIEINTSPLKKVGQNGPYKSDLLSLAYANKVQLASGVTSSITATGEFLFTTVCPRLLLYELVEVEKATTSSLRRYALTLLGKRLLSSIEREIVLKQTADKKAKAD